MSKIKKNIFRVGFVVAMALTFVLCLYFDSKPIKATGHANNSDFKSHVVFYPQHQDDELLWGGSAIVHAIKQNSADNVYVVLVSDGTGVNVFNRDPQFKDYTRKDKQDARDNEFKDSLSELGVKKENIILLADKATKEGLHFDLLKETILDFENKFKGDVSHISHHYKYDNHPMHRENGKTLKKLKDSNKVKEALYFMKPKDASKIPDSNKILYTINNDNEKQMLEKACMHYKDVNKDKKKFGIGYISSPNYFKHLLKDPKFTSIISNI